MRSSVKSSRLSIVVWRLFEIQKILMCLLIKKTWLFVLKHASKPFKHSDQLLKHSFEVLKHWEKIYSSTKSLKSLAECLKSRSRVCVITQSMPSQWIIIIIIIIIASFIPKKNEVLLSHISNFFEKSYEYTIYTCPKK